MEHTHRQVHSFLIAVLGAAALAGPSCMAAATGKAVILPGGFVAPGARDTAVREATAPMLRRQNAAYWVHAAPSADVMLTVTAVQVGKYEDRVRVTVDTGGEAEPV